MVLELVGIVKLRAQVGHQNWVSQDNLFEKEVQFKVVRRIRLK
jgi:hypothetical protein